jgi:hypothetical protein
MDSYNGWRNVETWRVQLHLANDEHEAEFLATAARQYLGRGRPAVVPPSHQPETFREFLPLYLQSKLLPEDPPEDTWELFKNDTVQAALSAVDWDEIADHWLEAARQEIRSQMIGRARTSMVAELGGESP